MDKQIVNAQLKFNCCADWNEMEKEVGGRNCQLCQRKVFDLTNSTQNDLDLILAENNYNICGRFSEDQLKPASINLPFWKKWVSAAMVLIGFNLFSTKAAAQHTKAEIKQEELTPFLRSFPLGKIAVTFDAFPEFPGGIKALNKFMQKNVNYKGTEGKVVVGFEIDKEGKVWNPRILSGLDSVTNVEALRVVRLSPKWHPATYKGKPTDITFTLPVIFQL